MHTLTITEANIELAKKGFADFGKGDIDAILDACTDDVTWSTWQNSTVPFAKTFKGKADVAQFFTTLADNVEYTAFNPTSFYASENKVFAKVYHAAIVKATGKSFAHNSLMEFTVEDEKIKGFLAYVDSADQINAFSKNEEEENKQIVQRFNKEFIEKGDISVFNEIISPSFINHTAPAGVPEGPEGVVIFFNHFLKPAFPDLAVEIIQQVAQADKVTTHKKFHATHTGEFMGIPATGKKVIFEIIDILRLQNKKFIEHWNVMNMQNVLQQITG
jgi:predicted ester cyclase